MFEIRPIVMSDNPQLREKSQIVGFPISKEDENDANYLLEYLKFVNVKENAEKFGLRVGVGLAAPQIGVLKRMIAIYIQDVDEEGKVTNVSQYLLINPKIISHSEQKSYLKSGEGCLSVAVDKEGYVPRYAFVTVEGYDLITKTMLKKKFRGYQSVVVQHELDHLDGVLYIDKINAENPYTPIPNALEI